MVLPVFGILSLVSYFLVGERVLIEYSVQKDLHLWMNLAERLRMYFARRIEASVRKDNTPERIKDWV